MTSLALLFVGAVLLVNGLVFLEVVAARAAAAVNTLTGLVLVATAFHLVLSAPAADGAALDAALGAAGFMLFGFTYLTVAANALTGADGRGLGFYCGWASAISVFLSAVNFFRFQDAGMGWLWLSWSVLFASFFVALAIPAPRLGRPAGTLTVLQSVTTATVPAALMLTDSWASTPTAAIAAVQLAVIAVYLVQVAAAWRRSVEETATGTMPASGEYSQVG